MAPRALVAVLLCAYTASAFVAAPKARVGALKLSAAKTDFSVAPLAGAAALAALAAPQVAYAEVGLGGEVAGVFLGLLPLAAIAAVVGGLVLGKVGGAVDKANNGKRNLALEYSAQKRFTKKDYI